jgi:hypothetical protein
MKKALVLCALVAGLVTSVYALDNGVTELENDAWFRFTYQDGPLTSYTTPQTLLDNFSLERNYVRLSHQWSNSFYSKMTVDMLSSSAYSDGASIRLKEAYVDYLLPIHFMDVKLTPGLQKNYFSLIAPWDYTNPEKSLADKEGIISSADYGLILNGNLPSGWGEFELGGYNGAGYKLAYGENPLNTAFDYVGNVRLTPIGGVSVGASYMYQQSDRSPYKNVVGGTYHGSKATTVALGDTINHDRTGIAPNVKLTLGPVSVLAEYISYDYTRQYQYYNSDTLGKVKDSALSVNSKGYHQNGFSIVPVVGLLKNQQLQLEGRFDMWNISPEGSTGAYVKDSLKSHTMYGAGFNWYFVKRSGGKPGLELQVFWEHQQPVATSVKPTNTVMAQVRYEWTHDILP